jgi:hypothetical protein
MFRQMGHAVSREWPITTDRMRDLLGHRMVRSSRAQQQESTNGSKERQEQRSQRG